MANLVWAVSDERRNEFTQKFERLIEGAPREILERHHYRIGWFTDSLYPIFDLSFIKELPEDIRTNIFNLHNNFIKGEVL